MNGYEVFETELKHRNGIPFYVEVLGKYCPPEDDIGLEETFYIKWVRNITTQKKIYPSASDLDVIIENYLTERRERR